MKTETQSLKEQWRALLETEPKLRIRDAAQKLGVSEAELLATRCGSDVIRLQGDWAELIKEFPRFGEVMCLTRNEYAVHERYGKFDEISFFGGPANMGQVVGPDIDLRLFMKSWHFGFAVTDATPEGPRKSLQFFDFDGTAVHKVYLQAESDHAAYDELVAKFRNDDQGETQVTGPVNNGHGGPTAEKPDSEVDVAGFRQAWLGMKDTHEFFILMRRFGLSRTQALRLAPEGYSRQVSNASAKTMLETASAEKIDIMVFIGSSGCIQIHTGPVENIRMFGEEWLNVLDDKFNMHLRQSGVAASWIVKKPTVDGAVTSLELYDANGENLVLFFGKRKPGHPEDPRWTALADSLA